MKVRIEFQVRRGTNRPAAPDLFVLELRATLSIAAAAPTLGVPARDMALPGVRRLLLQQTRYHVYYRVAGRLFRFSRFGTRCAEPARGSSKDYSIWRVSRCLATHVEVQASNSLAETP
jgi:hypothetical protein